MVLQYLKESSRSSLIVENLVSNNLKLGSHYRAVLTVESNYVIAIATLSDWLKRLAPAFQPMRSKTKTNRAMYA